MMFSGDYLRLFNHFLAIQLDLGRFDPVSGPKLSPNSLLLLFFLYLNRNDIRGKRLMGVEIMQSGHQESPQLATWEVHLSTHSLIT
jgi:hypothetical protein